MLEPLVRFFAPKPLSVIPYYVAGAVVFSILVVILLINLPARARKPLIAIVTFLAGLFYATESSGPSTRQPTKLPYRLSVSASKLGSLLAGMTLTLGI
jgi:hypothetical protein